MKNVSRLLSLAVILVMLCVSLCGCADIEQMRKEHAFWNEDSSITYNGFNYRIINKNGELEYDTYDIIYITEPDVPVLLKGYFGSWAYVSEDGYIIEYNGSYYCREDKYDYMYQKLKNETYINCYGYKYYDVESESENIYILTEVEKNAVDLIMSQQATQATGSDEYEYDFSVNLFECSSDGLIIGDMVGMLCDRDGMYYIMIDGEGNKMKYTVPYTQDRYIFSDIMGREVVSQFNI